MVPGLPDVHLWRDPVDGQQRYAHISVMNAQLSALLDQFDEATARLDRLAYTLADSQWNTRTDPNRWSPAECVDHLNITSAAYLPILDEAIRRARSINAAAPTRYRRDFVGWMLWKTMGPPVRQRVKTTAAFLPSADVPPAQLIAEFRRLQEEQKNRVRLCDGLPLQKTRVQSPFSERVKYNLFSCLTILPAHQHRHLWQAEQSARS